MVTFFSISSKAFRVGRDDKKREIKKFSLSPVSDVGNLQGCRHFSMKTKCHVFFTFLVHQLRKVTKSVTTPLFLRLQCEAGAFFFVFSGNL